MPIERLNTVVLEVADLAQATTLYRNAFGVDLHRADHGRHDDGEVDRWIEGEHTACSWTEGAFLHFALYQAKAEDPTRGAQVGFVVEDLERAHARAVAAGAEVEHPPRPEPWGLTARYRDLDGNVISLTERQPGEPVPRPGPGSDTALLRPVEERDLKMLARIDTDPTVSEPFEWRGFRDPKARRRRFEQDGYLGTDDSLLVVALPDGSFAGIVVWRPVALAGGFRESCFNIGILLFPEHRGRGLGTAAQRALADYLFSTTPVHRLEARTEVDNIAEERALEHAGFVREGVIRGGWGHGRWVDGVLYGRLREDPVPADRR